MIEALEYGRRRDLALLLRQLKSAVAEEVTRDFLERHPDWVERYGDLARLRGVEDATFHLDFLAGAVEGGSPEAFADYGRWTAGMLAARNISPPFLVENFEQIREALADRLDPDVNGVVRAVVQAGIEAALATVVEDNDRPSLEDDPLALDRSLYLQAVLRGDKRAAVAVVNEALERAPITQVYRGILEKAQVEVGHLWARNEISVAGEHMATAVSQYVLGELYSRLPVPERVMGRAVVTGVEGERHQFGANMVADLLEAEGWSVRFLGTQMPHRDILSAVQEHDARVVGISATMLFNVGSVSSLIQDLRKTVGDGLQIIVGGRAFRSSPDLWREIGADGQGGNLDEALESFRQLGIRG